MNRIQYKAVKNIARLTFGSADEESINFYADMVEKSGKRTKWASIFLGIVSIPLCLVLIGVITLIGAVVMFFMGNKKVKIAQSIREHVKDDPELSSS
jgi:hypothetical protein